MRASSYLDVMLDPPLIANIQHKVWIIVPVHNRLSVTKRCIRHLEVLGIRDWAKVMVVDDGSIDGTSEMLRVCFPWVRVSEGDGNLWWAGAIRLGMDAALAAGADCICWINDDSLPDQGSLEMLVKISLEHKAVCGGVSRTLDGAFVYSGGFIRRRWPRHAAIAPSPKEPPMAVEWLHGNMVAIPASVCAQVELPDCHWIKHNFADVDFTFRAHKAGIPVLLVPSATGVAERNDTASYWSWADPRLKSRAILQGFANPKVWWYAPSLVRFKIFHFGILGALDCGWLLCKAVAAMLLKYLPIQRLTFTKQRIRD